MNNQDRKQRLYMIIAIGDGVLVVSAFWIVGSFVISGAYNGYCGFLSEPCSYFSYLRHSSALFAVPAALISVPVLVALVVEGLTLYTLRKPLWWIHASAVVLVLGLLLMILFDPLEIV